MGRVRLYYDGRQEIIFRLTQEEISRICRQPAPELQNRSFLANLQDALIYELMHEIMVVLPLHADG